jgi:hypothetical protein
MSEALFDHERVSRQLPSFSTCAVQDGHLTVSTNEPRAAPGGEVATAAVNMHVIPISFCANSLWACIVQVWTAETALRVGLFAR